MKNRSRLLQLEVWQGKKSERENVRDAHWKVWSHKNISTAVILRRAVSFQPVTSSEFTGWPGDPTKQCIIEMSTPQKTLLSIQRRYTAVCTI